MEERIYIAAFFLSAVLHFSIQKIFIVKKKFDDFNHRSTHKTLATRTGGIGIFSTLLFIALFFYFQGVEIFDYSLFIPLGIMFVVGVYDDFYHADFKLKFLLQMIVAKILIDQGFVISNYYGLFGVHEVPWFLAQLSTVFVFLVVVNAINFIDGIDGLALTEVIKTILLIEYFSTQATPLAPLGLILIFAMLPLYYYNFKKKRKVFLGDGGSLFLGTLVMIYILYVLGPNYSISTNYSVNKVLFCVLVLLYPLVDLLRVFVLRIKIGQSPFVADQRHLHHKLINHLWTHSTIIIFISLIQLAILFLVVIF